MYTVLFAEESGDDWYVKKRNAQDAESIAARKYWDLLYEKHARFLDQKFRSQFIKDPIACLWELTLREFLHSHASESVEQIPLEGKNKSKPDFCFSVQGEKFYLEATTTSPGNRDGLNEAVEYNKAKFVPKTEYMESFCASIQEKGITRYKDHYVLEKGKKSLKKAMKVIWKRMQDIL